MGTFLQMLNANLAITARQWTNRTNALLALGFSEVASTAFQDCYDITIVAAEECNRCSLRPLPGSVTSNRRIQPNRGLYFPVCPDCKDYIW